MLLPSEPVHAVILRYTENYYGDRHEGCVLPAQNSDLITTTIDTVSYVRDTMSMNTTVLMELLIEAAGLGCPTSYRSKTYSSADPKNDNLLEFALRVHSES